MRDRVKHQAYLVAADGTRSPLDGTEIVVALDDGRELIIDLFTRSPGSVALVAGPRLTEQDRAAVLAGGSPQNCAGLVLYPAAGNVVHVRVE